MKRAVTLLPLALFGLAACNDSGTKPPDVDRVDVTPAESALGSLGATAQFSAQARDPSGAPLSGLDYSWSSSDPTVATVDATGQATAVSAGETNIEASTEGVTGSARLVIRECGAPLSLAPGEYTVLDITSQDLCGFILPAGNTGDRYRVGVVRTGSEATATDVPTISVEVTGLGVTSQAPYVDETITAAALPGIADPQLVAAARMAEETSRFHMRMREQEARMIQAIGTRGLLPDRRASGPLAAARVAPVDSPDRIMIDPATPSFCTPAGTPTPAFKVAENEDLAIYQDSAQSVNLPVTADQAQQVLDYYSTYGKPIIQDYFEGIGDIDGNGKVVVIIHPTVQSGTAAFVWSGDFFSKADCPASNEMELIFFNASLFRGLDDGNFQALETMVHEMKHVSSLYKSIARSNRLGQSSYHPSWIEEGAAEIAGNMSSRRAWSAVGGPAPNDKLVSANIRNQGGADGGGLKPEFYGVAIRMLRVQGYLASQPNGVVVDPVGASDDHSIYGSGWTFLRWLGDAYGNGGSAPYADAPFFREQVDSLSPAGVAGLESLTGKSFAQLMEEYAVAVMTNGTPAPQPTRAFSEYDFVSAVETFCFAADNPPCDGSSAGPAGTFPWPVTTQSDGIMYRFFNDATFQGKIGPAGLRIHELRSNGTGQGAEIVVDGPSDAKVVVVRIL